MFDWPGSLCYSTLCSLEILGANEMIMKNLTKADREYWTPKKEALELEKTLGKKFEEYFQKALEQPCFQQGNVRATGSQR